MAHNPVNHPLRPMYRAFGFLAGAYLVLFGIVGLIQTSGHDFTGSTGVRVLGQHSNTLTSIVALAVGGLVLLATAIGRNVDVEVDKYLGWGLLGLGSYELAFSRTDANVFGFSISTVVVIYLVGLVLITASLYGKVGPATPAAAPRQVREGRATEKV
jgi:peptidoglycan/LPS O-acetylase OafA/YrhL